MKKLIFAAAGAALVSLASCSDNNSVSTMSIPVTTYSMITNLVDGGDPVVAGTLYKFNLDMMTGTATVGGELPLSTDNKVTFVTNNLTCAIGTYTFEESYREVIKMESMKAGTASNKEDLINFKCDLTQLAYFPKKIQGLPEFSYPTYLRYAVMNFNLGQNYLVRTFWPDMTFRGTTTTSYPASDGSLKTFTNKDVQYRIVMNLKEKKATVILYDVKLAEEMPQTISNIVLSNLDLGFSSSGIYVSGSNVVPSVYEGGVATPNSKYTFDSFQCDMTGDLTTATMCYNVAGSYSGHFSGSYILKVASNED